MDSGYDKLYVSWVNIDEEQLTIHDMMKGDTVERFKRIIAQKTGSPETWSQISLHFGGEEMINEQTIESYGINNEDIVYRTVAIDPGQFPQKADPEPTYHEAMDISDAESDEDDIYRTFKTLFFKDLDGRTLTLEDVPVMVTVAVLRKKLADEKGIKAQHLRFIYGGKELQDEKLLEMYGLQNESTIQIVLRLYGGEGRPSALKGGF